jgi:hypothetical protein
MRAARFNSQFLFSHSQAELTDLPLPDLRMLDSNSAPNLRVVGSRSAAFRPCDCWVVQKLQGETRAGVLDGTVSRNLMDFFRKDATAASTWPGVRPALAWKKTQSMSS